MNNAPTIRGSAQARLLLYRLLSMSLSEAEQKLLSADPSIWEQILATLENSMMSETEAQSIESILSQVFSHIERSTRVGLEKQIERLSGQGLWLGVHPTALLDAFVDEHQRL